MPYNRTYANRGRYLARLGAAHYMSAQRHRLSVRGYSARYRLMKRGAALYRAGYRLGKVNGRYRAVRR